MHNDSPKIKFFSKRSGEKVAFTIHGQGPSLVVPAWWISHLELDWRHQPYRHFFQRLGEHFTVVRYDRLGVGLSGRERKSFTLEDEVNTLGELIDHLSLTSCTLLGISCGGPTCILYTQNNREKVKQIVFLGSYVSGADTGNPAIQEAICSLVATYWGLGAKAILDLFDPNMDSQARKEISNDHKNSAEPKMAEALLKLSFSMDASEVASQLTIPALVIHRSDDRTVPFDAGRKLASTLPNAQLISLTGNVHLPWNGENSDKIIQAIIQFTGVSSEPELTVMEHNLFRKIGDVWTLSYAGQTVHVKDSRGLHDIALLIGKKGHEIHVAEFVSGDQSSPIESESEVLDEDAIRHYKQRIQSIKEDKQIAGASGDELLYASLEHEEDAILVVLKQGVGLGGRRRQFNGRAEKTRKSVTARIRAAVKKIALVHPQLGEHLQSSLKTGNFCCYTPASEITWLCH